MLGPTSSTACQAEHDDNGHFAGTLAVYDRTGRPQRRAGYRSGWLHGKEETFYWGSSDRRGEVSWRVGALDGVTQWWGRDGTQLVYGRFHEGQPCDGFTVRGYPGSEDQSACPPMVE